MGWGLVCSLIFFFFFFDGKSVMSMFCNVMLLLLYVHVCVTRTGWKTRPRPKTVILLIKQSINLNQRHCEHDKQAMISIMHRLLITEHVSLQGVFWSHVDVKF